MIGRHGVLALACVTLACAEQGREPSDESARADTAAAPHAALVSEPFVARDTIVYAFSIWESGNIHVEPLYVRGADGLPVEPPNDLATAEGRGFAQAAFARGTRLVPVHGGVPLDGHFVVDSVREAGCYGIGAAVRLLGEAPPAPRTGLAYITLPDEPGWLDVAADTEDSIARGLALDQLRRDSIPEAKLAEIDWQPTRFVMGGTLLPTIIASGEIRGAHPDAEMPARTFVMLEMDGSTPRVIDSNHGDGTLIEGGGSLFHDAADLDGDGTPEVVLRNQFYESWTYTIWRRTSAGWSRIFEGGGSGC